MKIILFEIEFVKVRFTYWYKWQIDFKLRWPYYQGYCFSYSNTLFVKLKTLCSLQGELLLFMASYDILSFSISHLLCYRILKLKCLFQGLCRKEGYSEAFLEDSIFLYLAVHRMVYIVIISSLGLSAVLVSFFKLLWTSVVW